MNTATGHILVVDDDAEILTFLRRHLNGEGYRVTTLNSAIDALKLIEEPVGEKNDFDLIISDINMPEMNGLTFIDEVKKSCPEVPVVTITAFGSIESAVEALKKHAYDYLTKPISTIDLDASVNRAIEFRKLERENTFLRQEVRENWALGEMIGKSQQMQLIFDLIKRSARVSASVLILGESGTGKEMVARAIHHESSRRRKPFLTINCATVPESLLEIEIFGRKGSGGLIAEANGGTLFLDEIDDLDMALQGKLLKFLEPNQELDVRIIAASNRDLKTSIAQKRFREDLHFKLCVIPIYIPPLRERTEDIPLFARFFLKKYALVNRSKATDFSKGALAKLLDLPWEGNVRQLENAIERAVIVSEGEVIGEGDISPVHIPNREETHFQSLGVLTFKEMERRCLEHALQRAGGKKEKAAQILGISRKTLYRKEKEFGLS